MARQLVISSEGEICNDRVAKLNWNSRVVWFLVLFPPSQAMNPLNFAGVANSTVKGLWGSE